MELRHLRYFIAVESNLSFSEASRRSRGPDREKAREL